MMNLEQLRAKRNELAEKMAAAGKLEADGAELTEEQLSEFEANAAEFDKVDAQVKRCEVIERTRARLDEPRVSPGATAVVDALAPVATPGQMIPGSLIPGGPEAVKTFDCFEEFLCAVNFARTGNHVDQRLDFHNPTLRGEQSMGDGSKGGFMVPTEFRAELLRVDPAQTPLLNSVMRLPPGSSPDAAVTLPALDQGTNQHGGVTVSRIAEGATKPETDFDLKQVSWTPTEIAGHVALTNQLIRNWTGSMGMAQSLLRSALNAAMESEVYNGDGVGKPLGILQSGASYSVNRATASDFVFADVANMVARKLQRGGGAFWLYNPLHIAKLIQMKDGNNNLVWQQSIVPGSPTMLWGLPAFAYEFAAAVGALGDVCLVQPNPYYVFKEGSGPFVDVGLINDDFTKNKRRVLIFTLNNGGPWLQAPFKLQNGTEVSPFVLLDVPS
jgi:HK97 family phage major capsid protein